MRNCDRVEALQNGKGNEKGKIIEQSRGGMET